MIYALALSLDVVLAHDPLCYMACVRMLCVAACSVLSCKYVDEVIIGAPLAITADMIHTMNISVVVTGNDHGSVLCITCPPTLP